MDKKYTNRQFYRNLLVFYRHTTGYIIYTASLSIEKNIGIPIHCFWSQIFQYFLKLYKYTILSIDVKFL